MADCAAVDARLGALTVKNIFLTTKNRKRCYLCLTRPDARFHTADISRQIGSSRLSFAPEEMLFERLRCHGGSASPQHSSRKSDSPYHPSLLSINLLSLYSCRRARS